MKMKHPLGTVDRWQLLLAVASRVGPAPEGPSGDIYGQLKLWRFLSVDGRLIVDTNTTFIDNETPTAASGLTMTQALQNGSGIAPDLRSGPWLTGSSRNQWFPTTALESTTTARAAQVGP